MRVRARTRRSLEPAEAALRVLAANRMAGLNPLQSRVRASYSPVETYEHTYEMIITPPALIAQRYDELQLELSNQQPAAAAV